MSDTEKPQMACALRLKIEGNTRQDIKHALNDLITSFSMGKLTTGLTVGGGSSVLYEYLESNEPTKSEYFKKLDIYLAEKKQTATENK